MRTIFWTLMTDTQGQRETHRSNWVWYADGLKTKVKWQKEMLGKMWKSKRVPVFQKGLYGTISLGEIVKAFGTPEDKRQWKRTLESIGALGLSSWIEEPRERGIDLELMSDPEPSQSQSTTASSKETNQ